MEFHSFLLPLLFSALLLFSPEKSDQDMLLDAGVFNIQQCTVHSPYLIYNRSLPTVLFKILLMHNHLKQYRDKL